jgi:exopolysaccharide biosynthesis polyprenyl glycosylphosphotransferase
MVLSDAVALACGTYLTIYGPLETSQISNRRAGLVIFPLMSLMLLALSGSYRRRLQAAVLDEVARVAGLVALAAIISVGLIGLAGSTATPATAVLRPWILSTGLICAGRVLIALSYQVLSTRGSVGMPTLIVGSEGVGTRIARRIQSDPHVGLRVIGFVDPAPLIEGDATGHCAPRLGAPHEIAEIAERTGAQHVILAFTSLSDGEMESLARQCFTLGLEVSVVPRMMDSVNRRVTVETVGGIPVLRLRVVDPRSPLFGFKHVIDRVVAAILVVFLGPVLLACGIAVRMSSPGPMIFRQKRTGRDGRVFDMLKFRTMSVAQSRPEQFQLAPGLAPGGVEGEDRRTPVGRFLRTTSLDELPQLLNVLRGEMSVVGPRPERPEFAEVFQRDLARYADRHRVKAGITGWAQIHGLRGQTPLDERIDYDNYYINNWSPWLDLKILVATVPALFRGE